jgi:RecA/RadA recombinase
MEKDKTLDAAMAQIERAFGKGSIMRMGARAGDETIEVIRFPRTKLQPQRRAVTFDQSKAA